MYHHLTSHFESVYRSSFSWAALSGDKEPNYLGIVHQNKTCRLEKKKKKSIVLERLASFGNKNSIKS